MSPQTQIILIALLFAWAAASLFYSRVVRPVLRDSLRFKLFALRDHIRRMGVEGGVAPSSFNYMYLEHMLCRLIDRCFWYTWGSLFEFMWKMRADKPPYDAQRFEDKAGKELKAIRDQTIDVMLLVMAVNSPITTMAILGASKLLVLFNSACETWLRFNAFIYFQEPLEIVDPARGMRIATA